MKITKNVETSNPKGKDAFSRYWIRLNLGLNGFTIRSFAEKNGVKDGTVSVVFSRPYPRMERLIADTLGLAPETIWPSRYDSAGRPNRRNRWYDRKLGVWKPKVTQKNLESRRNILNEDRDEANKQRPD
jgi:Ner family transcriptional regulator